MRDKKQKLFVIVGFIAFAATIIEAGILAWQTTQVFPQVIIQFIFNLGKKL